MGAKSMWRCLAALMLMMSIAACDSGSGGDAASDADRENVDAMSREHADDSNTPSAAADIAPRRPVVAETLPYAEVEEQLVYGHFVFPADMVDPLPGVIVIHEWWGLNDGVRAMADRLAGEGYVVLAVDLFAGQTAATPAEARELMVQVVENPERANENIRQAYRFLRESGQAPSIASLGWCFGGGWSLNTALLFPTELDAAVIYYGQVTDDETVLAPLEVPILGLFGENDRGIRVDAVRAFEDALGNLDKEFEIQVYDDVGHAFANPTGNNYNAEVAEQAWARTLEFLQEHLSADSD